MTKICLLCGYIFENNSAITFWYYHPCKKSAIMTMFVKMLEKHWCGYSFCKKRNAGLALPNRCHFKIRRTKCTESLTKRC